MHGPLLSDRIGEEFIRSPRIVRSAAYRASLASLGAFVLVATIDEPSHLDRALYARARKLHSPWLEAVQRPLEVLGLPGVHIPIALLAARVLSRRCPPFPSRPGLEQGL